MARVITIQLNTQFQRLGERISAIKKNNAGVSRSNDQSNKLNYLPIVYLIEKGQIIIMFGFWGPGFYFFL